MEDMEYPTTISHNDSLLERRPSRVPMTRCSDANDATMTLLIRAKLVILRVNDANDANDANFQIGHSENKFCKWSLRNLFPL